MKRRTSFAWLFALAFGIGLTFSSCKDNITSNGDLTPEEQMDKSSERAEALLSVLSMTAGVDSLPDDWYKSSYTVEPTVGRVLDASNPYVRYVAVSSLEEAEVEYKSMFSGDVTGTAKDDKWRMDGIGQLIFTVKNQPDVTATVDVNVQQLPHLTQIRFVPPSVIGDNSNFKSYYHFGDVVKLKADGSYWICVRPTSSAAGKNLSHWVSFNTNASNALVNPNFKTYTKSGHSLSLPYSLGDKTNSEKHIPDFFNLYKALKANYRSSEDEGQGIRPDVKGKKKYTIGDIELPADSVLAISDLWRDQGYWSEKDDQILMQPTVQQVLDTKINRGQTVNVFYYGHHYWFSPDVHMLKINCKNESYDEVEKLEYKFAFPNVNTSFADYSLRGSSSVCSYLVDNSKTESLPENAFVMRYKSGPELSGKSNLFGNDKDPATSFVDYSDLVEDVYVYTVEKQKKEQGHGYFVVGDYVTMQELQDYRICVKSAVGAYKNTPKHSLFIQTTGDDDEELVAITNEEARVVAFNILNSYLLKKGKFNKNAMQSLGEDYRASLEALGNFLNEMEEKYDPQYSFRYTDAAPGVPQLTILFYVNINGEPKVVSYRVSYYGGTYQYSVVEDNLNNKKYVVPVLVYNDSSEDEQKYTVDNYVNQAQCNSRAQAQLEAANFYNKAKKEGN